MNGFQFNPDIKFCVKCPPLSLKQIHNTKITQNTKQDLLIGDSLNFIDLKDAT